MARQTSVAVDNGVARFEQLQLKAPNTQTNYFVRFSTVPASVEVLVPILLEVCHEGFFQSITLAGFSACIECPTGTFEVRP